MRRTAQRAGFDEPSKLRVQAVDTDNTVFLIRHLARHGWVDETRYGPEATQAAALLVLHSADLRLQKTTLPWVRADVQPGRRNGQSYALLHDRLQLRLGFRQRYGSQLASTDVGDAVLLPLEDPEHVDERRRALGMQPLAEYLEWTPLRGRVRTLDEFLSEHPSPPAGDDPREDP